MDKGKDFCIIDTHVKIGGNFNCDSNLIIDGVILGDVKTSKDIKLGPNSVVVGNILGRKINISGSVFGDIIASSKLILLEEAVIIGNVTAQELEFASARYFYGRVEIGVKRLHGINEKAFISSNLRKKDNFKGFRSGKVVKVEKTEQPSSISREVNKEENNKDFKDIW